MKSAQLAALCKPETVLQRRALITAQSNEIGVFLFVCLALRLFEVYPKIFMLQLLKAFFPHLQIWSHAKSYSTACSHLLHGG